MRPHPVHGLCHSTLWQIDKVELRLIAERVGGDGAQVHVDPSHPTGKGEDFVVYALQPSRNRAGSGDDKLSSVSQSPVCDCERNRRMTNSE
jgi:hypothetical protein